jgi:hypothetical protein
MKRLTLVAVMAAFLASIASSYAEVQHVRLSGELRLRAYWTKNLTDLYDANPIGFNDSDTYIAQRTRVTVESDVDDNIMVVVTLQARNVWGGDSAEPTGFFNGGNSLGAQPGSIVHLVEAFVRFQEAFWSPLTVTLGRQGLHFGNGLIFSGNDREYRYDAARFEWDQADNGFKVDFVFAKLVSRTSGAGPGTPGAGAFNFRRDADVYFLNVRWEPKDIKFIQNMEAYIGYQAARYGTPGFGAFDAYIWTLGFRGDATPLPDNDKAKSWKIWWELAVQSGTEGAFADNKNGWLLDVGTSYVLENMEWKPVIWAGYTVATGHRLVEGPGNRDFVPWFDYNTRGGFMMSPILANIQIWAFGAMASPNDKWAFAASAYRYIQDRADFGTGNAGPFGYGGHGNPFVDNGGIAAVTNGSARSLGWEFNLSAGYKYSKDVSTSFSFGYFSPGSAYRGAGFVPAGLDADEAFEFRGEITVNF